MYRTPPVTAACSVDHLSLEVLHAHDWIRCCRCHTGWESVLTAGTHPPSRVAARTALDDPTIVAIFDAANTWDIESSTLGEKSHNPEVATLARNFVRDHEMVRQQGRDLAKKLKLTPTPPKDFPLAQVHADAMAKLKTLSGPQSIVSTSRTKSRITRQ